MERELPKGWCVNDRGELRRETIHSMLRRLPGWNYRQPWIYQITITCADRAASPLGQIVVRSRTALAARTKHLAGGEWISLVDARGQFAPEDVEAHVDYTPLGAATRALFERFPEFTPEIRPLACQIMPDHLHFIVHVTREMKRPLGNAIGGFKTGCEKIFRQMGGSGHLFAEGFQDTILFHEGQLDNMFSYLADNPRRRAVKALFPDLFTVVRELAVPLFLDNGAGCPVPRAKARGYFSAIGNRFLLQRHLVQVQCSRSLFAYARVPKPGGGTKIARNAQGEPITQKSTPEFEERKAAFFTAARHGAVLISPCVSEGERQIAHEAFKAGLPLVTLHNKGFSRLFKPSGRYFDACSQGRLLMLAPAAWPHQPGEKAMTRNDATAMNHLCQWIAGPGAAEINYHGLQPANIDALAQAAARVVRG